jgi:crotonobetainyl-CoA:carnitine CoA-transferase CaiB-like acyl-CoA transferase
MTAAPLDGVVVVEAGTYMSAPLGAMMLAQLGARVIKVEPPAGDPYRKYGLRHAGMSASWVDVNHGKESVALDLKAAGDRARMDELLAGADVFVQNWRPGVADGLGYAAEILSARYPRLVHLAISGFGETGPRSSVPVFDGLLQAASGFAATEAGPGNPPVMTRSFIVDKITATFATQAVLAALVERSRTGVGTHLELAMLDVMAFFNFPDLGQDRTFLPPAPAVDMPPARSAILRTSDGHILVSPVSGRQIAGAVTAVGHPEWKHDLKRIDSPSRLLHELLDRLESVTRAWTTDACATAFADHDVPAAVVVDMDAHFADAQTLHNEIYDAVETAFGPVRRVRHPLRMGGALMRPAAPSPALGDSPATLPE